MAWVLRGLRNGFVTTRFPRRADDYGPEFCGVVDPTTSAPGEPGPALGACPTGAISADRSTGPTILHLDRGRCILCGRCAALEPERFVVSARVTTATVGRRALVVPPTAQDERDLADLRAALAGRVRALRRSVHVRHVDAGSDGAEEWEVAALTNPVYDVQRLGIFFTATPRHADVLLVTGSGTAGMAGPLRRTYDAMPEPRVVIAAGADAASGGLVAPTYASGGGIGEILPVDVVVPGSPPSPFSLLHGILLGIGRLDPGASP